MSRTEELTDAARQLSLSAAQFHIIAEPLASPILKAIEERFVKQLGMRWWWEDLRGGPLTKMHFPDGSGWKHLKDIAPSNYGVVWLVVENDPNFVLCEAEGEAIMSVIGECSAFEYYVVAQNLDWLVCENHSDVMFAVGEAVAGRLSLVASSLG